jgi:hypothetical protein
MAKTLDQLSADVLDELGEDNTDATLLLQANKWVQRIYDDVGDTMDWRFNWISTTVVTVASQRLYTLNVDVRDISSGRIQTTGEILEYRSKDHLQSYGYDMEVTGTPIYYYHDTFDTATQAHKIGLYPIPNAVVTIDFQCVGRPTTLSPSSTIPVPNEFLGLIHEGALALGHRHEREWESFDRTWNMYLKHKDNLKRAYMHPRAKTLQLQPTDVPRQYGVNPVRLPPGRFRNWW